MIDIMDHVLKEVRRYYSIAYEDNQDEFEQIQKDLLTICDRPWEKGPFAANNDF